MAMLGWAIGLVTVVALAFMMRPFLQTGSLKITAAVLASVLALGGVGLYLGLGAPHLPAASQKARLEALRQRDPRTLRPQELEMLLLARLREFPEEAQGWRYLGTLYMGLGRHAEAATAFGRALGLTDPHGGPPDVDLLLSLAEAVLREGDGLMTPRARAVIAVARDVSPEHPGVRFFSALELEQVGDEEAAKAAFRALLDEGVDPWARAAARQLGEAPMMAAPSGEKAPRGPNAEQVAGAAAMAPEERLAMIEGMVASLDARLQEEPGDVDGWLRLIRSYGVLGREEDRTAALARAREALAGDAEALARIDAAASQPMPASSFGAADTP